MTTRALPQSKKAKAPFRITGPGRYRTRGGDTVTLTAYTDKESIYYKAGHRWRFGPCESQSVTDAGRYFTTLGTTQHDIVARATKPRAPAKPKAARRPRPKARYVVDPDPLSVRGFIVVRAASGMTRSTARRLAAWLNREGR